MDKIKEQKRALLQELKIALNESIIEGRSNIWRNMREWFLSKVDKSNSQE